MDEYSVVVTTGQQIDALTDEQLDADADFPARMRRTRRAAGFTQQQLADELGCNYMSISRLETDPNLWRTSKLVRPIEQLLNAHLVGPQAGTPMRAPDVSHLSTRELAEGLARSLESDERVRETARAALRRLAAGDFADDAERAELVSTVEAALTGRGGEPE